MLGKWRKRTGALLTAALLLSTVPVPASGAGETEETNIALQADVTVSSYYGNDPSYAGERAADGRMDTEWASAESSPWIQLDWDGMYEIS